MIIIYISVKLPCKINIEWIVWKDDIYQQKKDFPLNIDVCVHLYRIFKLVIGQ